MGSYKGTNGADGTTWPGPTDGKLQPHADATATLPVDRKRQSQLAAETTADHTGAGPGAIETEWSANLGSDYAGRGSGSNQ